MDLSPSPVLDAAEGYRGKFVDLDTGRVVAADAFHLGRRQLADRLTRDFGSLAGERVVVCLGNGPQFVATMLVLLARRGSPLFVHPKTPPSELKRIALRYGARLVISDECPAADLQNELGPLTTLEPADWIELRAVQVDPKTPGFDAEYVKLPGVPLHPTSGTTGQPKMAVRPGRAAVEEARHYIDTIGITSSDAILAVAPMCHAYAFGMCVMVPLVSGARVVSMRGFQANRVFQGLEQERVTILPAVPAMLDVLLFAGDRLRNTVRCVLSAGSPLSERTAARFDTRSGLKVRPLYGTTETGGITVAPAGECNLPATTSVRRCAASRPRSAPIPRTAMRRREWGGCSFAPRR